jgi:putative addiction module killer protein
MAPVKVSKTSEFDKWFRKLKDVRTQVIINAHIDRMIMGDFGKTRHVGNGVWEKKINYGSGYRLYYCKIGKTWLLLLCGGSKSTQRLDINQAKEIKKGL